MHNFKKLNIWILSMELAKDIYEITRTFPKEEMYGLISQMRRCSVSIPSNIAEATSRNSNKEVAHFLDFSIGSIFELETQLLISKELNFLEERESNIIENKIIELQKMIFGFRKNIINQSVSKNLDS
ncbi:MAG: four helix bundle protein [Bacteroidetes bacterium]|nr:four helix bundle protein [Bacteroidota bacterium]